MGVFDWIGSRGLPPLDGDDENCQLGAAGWTRRASWPSKPGKFSKRCHTEGCTRLTTSDLPFCNPCITARIRTVALDGEAALDALPIRPMTDVELPAIPAIPAIPAVSPSAVSSAMDALRRLDGPSFAAAAASELAAPLFEEAWLDQRCRWCRMLVAEFDMTRRAAVINPETHNCALPQHECARHQIRRNAHEEVLQMFVYLREKCRYDSEEIAQFYQFGYLGDRLDDEQRLP